MNPITLTTLANLNRNAEELFKKAKPEDPVATCPGWTVKDLSDHMARVYQLMAFRIRENANPDGADITAHAPGGCSMCGWLELNFEKLYDLLESVSLSDPAWNWTGKDMTVGWILRRLIHEVAIHVVDLAIAVDHTEELDTIGITTELATDGLDELLLVFLPARTDKREPGGVRHSLHMHALDSNVEWTANFSNSSFEAVPEHGSAEAKAVGNTVDLYLFGWNRPSQVELSGSEEAVRAFRLLKR
jgi:uncharacterized protein (TIGR03083 family)